MVVDPAAPDSSLAVQNTGSPGVPGSPHYQDRFAQRLEGRCRVVHFDGDAADAACESRMRMRLGKGWEPGLLRFWPVSPRAKNPWSIGPKPLTAP
jgi:hypothetical protein